MEKYKIKLKHRIILFAVLFILSTAVYVCGALGIPELILSSSDSSDFSYFFKGFQTGIFTVLVFKSAASIIIYAGALRNAEKLKKLYIKENDERKVAITQKSGINLISLAGNTILFAILLAGYFSKTVFFTLLAALCIIDLCYYCLTIYYSKTM